MNEEPKIDESELSEQQKEELHKPLFSKKTWIVLGSILLLMLVCVIVILAVNPFVSK